MWENVKIRRSVARRVLNPVGWDERLGSVAEWRSTGMEGAMVALRCSAIRLRGGSGMGGSFGIGSLVFDGIRIAGAGSSKALDRLAAVRGLWERGAGAMLPYCTSVVEDSARPWRSRRAGLAVGEAAAVDAPARPIGAGLARNGLSSSRRPGEAVSFRRPGVKGLLELRKLGVLRGGRRSPDRRKLGVPLARWMTRVTALTSFLPAL